MNESVCVCDIDNLHLVSLTSSLSSTSLPPISISACGTILFSSLSSKVVFSVSSTMTISLLVFFSASFCALLTIFANALRWSLVGLSGSKTEGSGDESFSVVPWTCTVAGD